MAAARTVVGNGDELIDLVHALVAKEEFAPRDFVLAGSARLLREGIIEAISDIDIIARGATLDRAFELTHREGHGGITIGENTGDKIAQLHGGRINVSARWLTGAGSTDALIDRGEMLNGLRYFSLEDVIAYKLKLDRQKDRTDLGQLRQRLGRPLLAPTELVRTVHGLLLMLLVGGGRFLSRGFLLGGFGLVRG